ncbi:MAG: MarC family protein [Desulfobacteraceae bacterium]|nr:MarC family protein [Desulfobacteraceae bacterium]MBC2754257.1 MarC family protein [Desulfobacteraceae bacterium]
MESFIKAFIAYFVIVDPVGMALIFNGLTAGKDYAYSRKMALRAVFFSIVLVLCFGFWGRDLLTVFGIEMDSFKIAGGLLIFYAAFGMITKSNDFGGGSDVMEDISVFPLSIPLIAGPGCLTLTVLLFSRVHEHNANIFPLLAAIFCVFLLTLTGMLFSKFVVKMVGETLNNLFKRLLGILLASLAVQFIADGIKGLMG